MKYPLAAATAALALVALAGCAATSAAGSASGAGTGTPSAKPVVVASTDVWGSVVAQIGGDAVDVSSIITNPDADPHEYEASGRVQLQLSKADIVIENGGGYDDFVDTMLRSAHAKATVIDAVKVAGVGDDPVLGDLNEHVWYDFDAVRAVAAEIQKRLAAAAPGESATFAANARTFDGKLDALAADEKRVAAAATGKGAAITEPVPLYMLEACGLVDRTPPAFSKGIEDDTDVPADVLQQTLGLFSGHQVALLAYNEQTTGPQTEAVLSAAKQAGIPVVPVTETLPKGDDYLSWMTANLHAIGAAVGVDLS